MNRSNWEFVNVNGSNGKVVTLRCETSLIGNPGQSESLALWGDPVRGSFVGVTVDILVLVSSVIIAVRVLGVNDACADLFLGLGLFAGGAVRSSIATS